MGNCPDEWVIVRTLPSPPPPLPTPRQSKRGSRMISEGQAVAIHPAILHTFRHYSKMEEKNKEWIKGNILG